jgi:hypothetical protein
LYYLSKPGTLISRDCSEIGALNLRFSKLRSTLDCLRHPYAIYVCQKLQWPLLAHPAEP